MNDPTLIADLIRAGVAPDLVARVSTIIASTVDYSVDKKAVDKRRAYQREWIRKKRAKTKTSESIPADDLSTQMSMSTEQSTVDTQVSLSFLPSLESLPVKKESKRDPRARASEFDQFWELYPNKVGKQAARVAFEAVMRRAAVAFDQLMTGLGTYVAKTDDRPWCNPATWLNQHRWEDKPARPHNGKSVLAAADRAIERFGGMEAARAYVPGSEGPRPLSLDFGPSPARAKRISSG